MLNRMWGVSSTVNLRCPPPGSYGMDVPAMLLEQHERGIHVVLSVTGDATVTEGPSDVRVAAHAASGRSGILA